MSTDTKDKSSLQETIERGRQWWLLGRMAFVPTLYFAIVQLLFRAEQKPDRVNVNKYGLEIDRKVII